MNDQQKRKQYSGVRDQEIRAALDQHCLGIVLSEAAKAQTRQA